MKTEKSKKLRGSVLLTVVSVMSLLIIFLSGTLVLASAANNRAHINYSSAQAGITSRAVIDASLQAIHESESYANSICSFGPTSVSGAIQHLEVPVSINSDSSDVSEGGFGHIEDVSIDFVGTKEYYNESTKSWVLRNIVKFTSNVTLGGVTSTTSAYAVIDPPQPSSGGGGGAGFVTTGGANLNTQTMLFGGAYLNLPTLAEAEAYDYSDPTTYRTNKDFTFSNTGSGFEANTVINGNIITGDMDKIVFPGKGKGVTVWGNWTFSGSHLKYQPDAPDKSYSSGIRSSDFDSSNPIAFNEIPYIYVDGTIFAKDADQSFGKDGEDFPLNVFCSDLQVDSSGKFIARADIYCMDPSKESLIKCSNNASRLYGWTSSVLNKSTGNIETGMRGNFYTKGSLKVSYKGFNVDGGLYVEKNLTVDEEQELVVKGAVYVGGELNVTKGTLECKELYCDRTKIHVASGATLKVNGKTFTSSGEEATLKDGYKRVANKYVLDSKKLKSGITMYENAIGDFKEVENIEHGTIEVENIEHGYTAVENAVHEYIEVPNLRYEYESKDGTGNAPFVDKFGNETWWIPPELHNGYYVKADIDGNETDEKTEREFSYYDEYGNFYDNDPGDFFYTKVDLDGNDTGEKVDNSVSYYDENGNYYSSVDTSGYYTRADKDGNDTGERVNNSYSYYDEDGNLKDSPETWYTKADKDGNDTNERTESRYTYYDRLGRECLPRDIYYIKCKPDGSTPSPVTETDKTSNQYVYYNEDDNEVSETDAYENDPAHYVEVDADGEVVYDGDGNEVRADGPFSYFNAANGRVAESDAVEVDSAMVNPCPASVYPSYAERDVILGLSSISGVDKEDTQVVMTMKEVLEEVVNPYNNADLPNSIKGIYDTLMADASANTYTDLETLKKEAGDGKVVSGVNYSHGDMRINTTFYKANTGSPYVTKSCIIDISGMGADYFKGGQQFVFDPGAGEMLIVVKNLKFLDGADVYVDDSQGGSVYFYLEDGAEMAFQNNFIVSSYMKLFKDDIDFQIYTDPSYARKVGGVEAPKSFNTLGLSSPHVYIYGKSGSKLNISNAKFLSANIISPNIEVTSTVISHSDLINDNDVYYNGHKLNTDTHGMIFGCCNSRETTLSNNTCVVYIPDGTSNPPSVATPDGEHNVKVLYYDEY